MPNWCYNSLKIEGDEKAIARLLEMVKHPESVIDFNTVIPYPKVYADMDAIVNEEWPNGGKGFNSGGYNWCIENWGTKWNACDAYLSEIHSNCVEINFDTAWSPSLPVTAALAVAFPELTFTHKFEEGGCDFSGYAVYEDGQLANSADGAYNDYPITEHPVFDEDDNIVD